MANEDLNEDPARLQVDLEHLREWLSKQPHLRARSDDKFLLMFLRGCKYSLERTKEKIDAYYTMRSVMPELFGDRDPLSPLNQDILKLGIIVPLGLDAQGRRVIWTGNYHKIDHNLFKAVEMHKVAVMLVDSLLEEDGPLTAKGHAIIFDLEGVEMRLLVDYTPAFVNKLITFTQEAYPLRLKSVDYLHMPSLFQALLNLAKSFLKEKIRNRVHGHSDVNSLLHIPKEILPAEYGGSAGTITEIAEVWRKKIEERRDQFLEERQYGVDESKRPGKPKTYSDLFGIEGSFRQLTVD